MLFFLDIDIDLYLLVNGLFFNEEYISEVFHSKEEENFFLLYQDQLIDFFILL